MMHQVSTTDIKAIVGYLEAYNRQDEDRATTSQYKGSQPDSQGYRTQAEAGEEIIIIRIKL